MHLVEDVVRGRLLEKLKKMPYSKVFKELIVYYGVLLKGSRDVVPSNLTQKVIELAHESQGLGGTKTIRYLRESQVHKPFQGCCNLFQNPMIFLHFCVFTQIFICT